MSILTKPPASKPGRVCGNREDGGKVGTRPSESKLSSCVKKRGLKGVGPGKKIRAFGEALVRKPVLFMEWALAAGLQGVLVQTGKYRAGDEAKNSLPGATVLAEINAATEWILSRV